MYFKKISKKKMDGLTIDENLKNCSITKEFYRGICSINNIPVLKNVKPCFLVVNTDVVEGPGMHWIVLFFIRSNYVEIFDSLGQRPQAYGSHFIRYMKLQPSVEFVYSSRRLQSLDSNVCGAHCLLFSYKKCKKKISLTSFVKRYYLPDTDFNDCNAICFINKIFRIRKRVVRQMLNTVPKCSLDKCGYY